jgi:hypothetical protein
MEAVMRHSYRRLLALALVLSLSLVGWLTPDTVWPGRAQAATPGSQRYLGRWNYTQPDRGTLRNVAVVSCAAVSCAGTPVFEIPQIGDLVFSTAADGAIIGRTDQGCTWRFAVRPDSLELDPASQYCFNQVIGSGFTITRWSVTVSGPFERETLEAISYLPNGQYTFLLQNGSRTRVADRPNTVRRFLGVWGYDTADPRTGVNMLTTLHTGPNGQIDPIMSAQRGLVGFAEDHDHLLAARTGDGCRWTLRVRGNTAELQPAVQTCRHAGSSTTLRFWSIASDGRNQASTMAGTDDNGDNFVLNVGSLTKR